MIANEELLATYSLLSYIRESLGDEKRDTLAYVFIPLVKEGLSSVLSKHGFNEVKGKDYTEIKTQIADIFKIDIPIPVLETILPILSREAGGSFQLFKDHSFIIKSQVGNSIMGDYNDQKKRIQQLERNYKLFCQGEGVEPDFDGLISFIQDQKNRLFDKDNNIKIEDQNYHISKYINTLKEKKTSHYDTVCDLFLGGIISSYLNFQVNGQILDADLLIDTNFYISLINLNTEESFDTCKQLYDITVAMGFHYKILETTITQIKNLLNNRLSSFSQRNAYSVIDNADILAACERRHLNYSELQAYKDGLLSDLSKKGVTTIYKNNIPQLVNNVRKSPDLRTLTKLRNDSVDSAFNDLLAQEYVAYKRSQVPITEFVDVNCWFLTNSYSTNKKELSLPVWQRKCINAADLLVLLWYANPSLNIGKEKAMLAATSLSANILKYRAIKRPAERVIKELINKLAVLQNSGHITENALAMLCIRMSEGCIDNTEAERLISLPTQKLAEYANQFIEQSAAFIEEHEKNEKLQEKNDRLEQEKLEERIKGQIGTRKGWSIVYVLVIIALYIVFAYFIDSFTSSFWKGLVHVLYWLVTTVVVNWFSHSYFLDGLVSFFNYQRVFEKLMKAEQKKNEI